MSIEYSTSEAKAKFSEILRKVRSGKTVTVSYYGQPVAEIRPINERIPSNEDHLRRLQERGVIVPAKSPLLPFEPVVNRQGVLAQFLEDRNR